MAEPLFLKDPLQIIKEASLSDDMSGITEGTDELIDSILESYDGIETIPEGRMKFDARSFPITQINEGSYKKYLIDSDLLVKYMNVNNIKSVREAVNSLLESVKETDNVSISPYDVRIVVEGKNDMIESLKEAKQLSEDSPCNSYYKVKAGYNYYKDIYDSGIKMAQKQDSTIVPQYDRDSLMTGGNMHTLVTDQSFGNTDLGTQNMKGPGPKVSSFDKELDNNDWKTQNMKGGTSKGNITSNAFNNEDYVYGSMKGNKDSNIGIRISDAPFDYDDDINPMAGPSGKLNYNGNMTPNDDPNLNGMADGHKGF